jgi:hypothetical protein
MRVLLGLLTLALWPLIQSNDAHGTTMRRFLHYVGKNAVVNGCATPQCSITRMTDQYMSAELLNGPANIDTICEALGSYKNISMAYGWQSYSFQQEFEQGKTQCPEGLRYSYPSCEGPIGHHYLAPERPGYPPDPCMAGWSRWGAICYKAGLGGLLQLDSWDETCPAGWSEGFGAKGLSIGGPRTKFCYREGRVLVGHWAIDSPIGSVETWGHTKGHTQHFKIAACKLKQSFSSCGPLANFGHKGCYISDEMLDEMTF